MNDVAHGRLVATLLNCAWRESVSPCAVEVNENLLRTLAVSGALGLAGRRFPTTAESVAKLAQHTLWWQALRAADQSKIAADVVRALRGRGVDPVLFKGLATSRYYGFVGARPSGDIDLLISHADITVAEKVLRDLGYQTVRKEGPTSGMPVVAAVGPMARIDLQTGLWPLGTHDVRQTLSSDLSFMVADLPIRVPPAEVEIRFLAVHAAKHDFKRPLWLCDVAAAIEGAQDVDMERLSADSRRSRSWLAASIGAAVRLLGLRSVGSSLDRFAHAAEWLEPYILARWGGVNRPVGTRSDVIQAVAREHDLARACRLLAEAWPDRLAAEIILGWPLSPVLGPLAVFALGARRGLLLAWDFQRDWNLKT